MKTKRTVKIALLSSGLAACSMLISSCAILKSFKIPGMGGPSDRDQIHDLASDDYAWKNPGSLPRVPPAVTGNEWWNMGDDSAKSADRRPANVDRGSGNLTLGMTMSGVRSLWGMPSEVETAGQVDYGNQRWLYYEGLSQRWSTSAVRIVYFENGHVAGWETQ